MQQQLVTIDLSPEELDLVIDALDSHEYWQLSEPTSATTLLDHRGRRETGDRRRPSADLEARNR